MHLTPVTRSRTNYEGYIAAARSPLDEAAFEQAWAEGKAMTTEEAIEYALLKRRTRARRCLAAGGSASR